MNNHDTPRTPQVPAAIGNGLHTHEGANGTSATQRFPWGLYVKARLLCGDGKLRTSSRIASTADTFFSVPCAVKVRGRTVAGYMALEQDTYVFHTYTYRTNGRLLPDWVVEMVNIDGRYVHAMYVEVPLTDLQRGDLFQLVAQYDTDGTRLWESSRHEVIETYGAGPGGILTGEYRRLGGGRDTVTFRPTDQDRRLLRHNGVIFERGDDSVPDLAD